MDFIQYIFSEAKNKRLSKAQALEFFKQFQNIGGQAAVLHPLVHRNTSSLSEQRFSTKLSGEEFFLNDHVVQGRKVLPAAAQLEMARAAVAQALQLDDAQGRYVELRNVVFARPVVVGAEGLELHISLTAEDDGTVGYEIHSGPEEDAVVHGQGRATVAHAPASVLDISALQAACTSQTDAQQCYDAFAQRGLAYGPGFQGLQQVQAGQDGKGAFALAAIRLPQTVAATHSQYALHPSLIDAALQSCAGLMAGEDGQSRQLALPFALERVAMAAPLPEQCRVLVRASAGSEANASIQKLDIAIADEQGKVCVTLSGFSSRLFKPATDANEVKTVLMQPHWVEQELPEGGASYESHSIVLCEMPALEPVLATASPQAQVLRLNSEHATLAERYTDYAAQLLAHVQQLIASKPQGEVLIQLAMPAEGEATVLRGLGGLLKSASQENPKLIGQVLVLPEQSGQAMVERIAANAAAGAGEIRYEGNARQQWQLQPVTAGEAVQPWKDGGVYLITGGAGGLGLIFAQAIATQAKGATLVLTGRSALSESKEATLDVLRSLGAHVDYRRADIGDAEAVRELIEHIRQRHGKLDGVLHSAGVLRDSFLIKKTEEELREVFAPKVAGLLHLDAATQELELDHFIVFGSSAGVLGNVGQADYAAANAFMDAYAAYRNELVAQGERKGRTLSVDWPLWAEGGMQVDAATRERLWRATGLAPMESGAGVQALRQALSLESPQVTVFCGDAARIARMTQPATPKAIQPAAEVTPAQSTNVPSDLKARTTHYLTTLLSKALKLPAHRIDAQAALEQYGIDSVMIMDLSQVLENAFGPLSKTLFFEYQSIDALAGYFVQQHPQQLTRLLGLDQPVVQQAQGQAIAAAPQLALPPKRKGQRFQPAAPQRPQGALDIAIVGVSGRYPNAPDLDAYWTNLTQGIDCIREIPSDRWDHSRYFDSQRGQLGKSYSKWGGFIDGIDQFDPLFFNISPREAGVMDPQERLFLQCVYHTLEDAGYTRDSLARQHTGESKVGVFVGVMYEEYQLYGAQAQALGQGFALTGNAASIANRVSYWCNFHGPSLAVDTMCSSSLTAIHLACQSIMRGECEAAIAGGVNVTVHPNKYLLLSQGQFTSSEGLCRSFGQGGDGYVPGEGVGAVLLKPLAKAIEDGDRIYGVIKGSTLNHGGKTNGYTVPNPKAQGELITQALKESGIHPRTISYIEAHGTGTALGDPIEIAGLGKAFGSWTSDTGYCAIGSAKSNIGHCESAAGIAGLTKVLLQMQHQTLVKSLHSEELNPNIDFGKTPFVVQRETAAWKRPLVKLDQDREEREYPRRAGLSSFGAGGANAHLIVEEYTGPEQPRLAVTAQQPAVIVLSAKNEERLQEQAQQLLTALERHSDHDLADIAYTLQVGREAMDARLACLVSDLSMLKDKLTRYLAGETGIEDCYQGEVRRNREALSAFAADEDMQQTIAAWISKRKLGKLADLWAKGLVLDWSALYGDIKPRRISLPTYPFARERYWVPETAQLTVDVPAMQVLHPLVQRNTSSLAEQRFSSRFSGQEFFLADHQVQGKKILPGAAQLEMARAAAAHALELDEAQGHSVQLRQVVFARPVIVGEEGLDLHISLGAGEDGSVAYEIYSLAGEEAIVHGQGKAVMADAVPAPALDVATLRNAAVHHADGAQCYAAFTQIGLAYGPAFQGLRHVAAGDDAQGPFVVADIDLPQSVAPTQRHYGLHPSLIDTALQSCMGMLLGSPEQAQLALPFAIEQVALLGTLPAKGCVVVRHTAGHSNQSVQKLDITITDEQGQVCATMQGFSSRVLPGAALSALVTPAAETAVPAATLAATPASASTTAIKEEQGAVGELTLVPVWEVAEPEWTASWPQANQTLALIGGSPAQQQALQARYPRLRFLDVSAADSVESLTATLQSGPLPTHLFWLLPAGEGDAGSESLIAAQHQGVLLGLRLVKALLALGLDRQALGWTIVTEGAQAASAVEAIAPAHASVHGFIGALAKEYPRWPMRLVDLDDGASLPLDALLRLPANGQGNAWRYRLGQWQQQKLVQAHLEQATPVWRQGGVYVILGGAGGIGEVLSEHLIRQHQAHMIWIGRRPLDETIESKCQRLAAFGPQPHYLRADATDEMALQAALAEIQARHGHIDGLINATIVLKDQPLARMDEADFAAALAAKVDVSVNVARVFREAVRDFVLVFSSLQSSVKAHGQSNYAAGCTFADAHAHALRSQWPCPVKVVNWGYWGSVGIVADEQTRQRMAKFGMESIEPPEAMQVLDKLLVSPVDQIAFVKTSKPEVALSLGLLPGQRITVTHPTQATTPPQPSTLPLPLDEQGRQQVQALEAQLAALLHARLHELGLCWEGKALDIAGWKQGIALPKLYERWLDQSLQMLVQYGHLKQEGQAFIGGPDPDSATLWQGWEQAKAESAGNPQQQAQLALLDAMLQALPAILRGQMPATQAMFPNASMALVENIYKNNRIADYFNAVLADSLIDHIEQRLAHDPQARLRLLEIGAGTGGTSAKLFERLAPYAERIEQYAYTDISKAFLLHAQKHYAHQAPYLHTQLFNVEAPLAGQDIAAGSYDIVIATNVLHATKDMRRTLRNTKALLKREGLLLVNEVATSSLFTHLTFGLLEGWWLYDDGALRIAGSPALAPTTWQGLLQGEGFHRVTYPAEAAHALGQQVIAAVSNGVVRQEKPAAVGQPAATSSKPAQPARIAAASSTSATPASGNGSLRDKAIGYLKTMVAQTLTMSAHDLDANESWAVYGIDSILGMQITDALTKVFSDIDSTLLFEHQSIGALADHLVATQSDTLVRLLGLDAAPAAEVRTPAQADAPSLPAVSPATLRRTRRFLPTQTGTANPAGSAQVAPALKDIAIIGLSGRYPNARNLDAYWSNLLQGINCIREIPKQRWDWQAYHAADKNQMQWGRIYSKWGGFLDDIDCFDPLFFGISPREAERMIPQERLFLEEAYACLNDAGYTPATLSAQRQVGVYVGIMNSHYGPTPSYWSVANRVSYLFGFNGPSLAVDTACSSSLTAIHLALESLSTGRIDCAIAGGVNLIIDPVQYMGLSAMTMLSRGDACRSFGADADGFVDAEGVGAVLLKPLAKAIEDGDRIYGVIKGSSLNHGGKTNGYTVPNPKAQGELITQALKESGIHPRTISYIEAHGTGTALGDPIEIAGLGKAFGSWTSDTGYCAIGSAKSNIGHCESAAGIAGLTKVLLQMQHQTLVKSLHSEELNPNIDFGKTPFVVQRETAAWKRPLVKLDQDREEREYPRRAGLSSFGAGGANAHLIVEEYTGPEQPRLAVTAQQPAVIVLSAKNEERLQEQARQLLAALDRHSDHDLADIAYTLQVGREAMDARLACLVSDLSMLKDKLTRYLAGETGIEDLCQGEVRRNREALSAFAADEDMQQTIAAWIAKRKLGKLADLWAKGLVLDWSALYGDIKPRRISLPTYPFARERYWIEDMRASAAQAVTVPSGFTTLHPLLHANTSELTEQRFSSVFSGEEFFLKDHQVQGRKILPAAAHLELAREAVTRALGLHRDPQGQRQVQLERIVFARPVAMGSTPLELHIALAQQDDGSVHYEIYSEEGDTSVVHGQGIASLAQEVPPANIELTALQASCSRTLGAEDCYDAFAQLGLAYGPGFQGVQQVQVGQDQQGTFALARIRLPQTVAATHSQYVLHPSLIDAALQSCAGLMAGEDGQGRQLALPFALERVTIAAPLPDTCQVLVRPSTGSEANASVQKLDITIADEQGKVCVTLSGFTSRVIKPAAEANEVKTVLMQPQWVEQELPEGAASCESHRIVLCEMPALEPMLVVALPQAQVIRLRSEHITLAERYTDYAAQLLSHMQQLAAGKPQGEVLIQLVVPAEGEGAVLRGLGGLLKSANQENPKLVGQVLALPMQSEQAMAERIAANAAAGAGEIRYDQDARQHWQLQPITTGQAAQPWKDGGVYLITGGAGGLGLIFAQAIATQAKGATLVLTGRSALSESKEATLDVLRSLGAHVDYRRADIGDAEAVRELIEHIRQRHGKLDGVLHSAGVLRDSLLLKKTRQELEEVLAPKVAGLLNLDRLTQDLALDCMILFSSSAGVLGNVGQADYAAANAFMDAWASYRNMLVAQGQRKGKTLSVNWPLWAEGGMQLDAPTRERLWQVAGLAPMESEAGILALRQAWAYDASQIAVFAGDPQKIARLTSARTTPAQKAAVPATQQASSADTRELQAKLETMMIKSVSEILKIGRENIDVDVELSEFGFDSITLTSFGNELNQKYELELNPTVFFEHPTISTLSGYLARAHADVLSKHFGMAAKTVTAPVKSLAQADTAIAEKAMPAVRSLRNPRASVRHTAVVEAAAPTSEPVAIIGMSGCFPLAENIDALWENLLAGRDCIGEVPGSRWNWDVLYGDPAKEANKTNIKHAGVMEGVDHFDPLFFSISRREAQAMDPQQRLLMMHVWKVIEDAGYSAQSLSGSNTGLFIGTSVSGYSALLGKAGVAIEGYSATGMAPSVGPNRMSYLLNLHGPSEPIETACSSALVAVHRALLAMQAGQCEMAIVGGVNTLISPEPHISFSRAGMLSQDGKCKTFSAQANGYVRGEGVGMLMLKKLSAAERDGDHIYAVVRGSAENHGGRANSLTAPNPRAQAELIKTAFKVAGVDPATIGYIEAHGTGTPLGDPIEMQGMTLAFKELAQEEGQAIAEKSCGVGSIKTNIGHLELAAGAAGMIKAVLQMRHKTLVKSLHSEEINPYIQLQASPFYVVQENRAWEAPKDAQGRELPRRAGVSSFGFGGVNAHVVLEEYVPKVMREQMQVTPQQPVMIVLSAKNEDRLQEQATQLLGALDCYSDHDLADIAYTLQVGREAMDARLACLVSDLSMLKDKLARYLAGETGIEDCYQGEVRRNREALSAFAADEDMQQTIAAWIAKRKLGKLADLWAKGLVLDWSALYGDIKPRRISLPTYPFAKERYWVPETAQLTVDVQAMQVLHPLVQRNTSSLSEQRFSSRFSGQEFFLADHQVQGRMVLPGAAQLEMARAAVAQALELDEVQGQSVQLRQVVFARPVVVGEEGLELHISLGAEEDGTIAYEIYSVTGEEESVHGQGKAVVAEAPPVPALDVAVLRAAAVHHAEGTQCYDAFSQIGLAYGPAFQGLQRIAAGDDAQGAFVVADIALPQVVVPSQRHYGLHPSVIDTALQSCMGMMLGNPEDAQLALPFAVEQVVLLGELPAKGHVVVRNTAGHASQSVQKLDIAIADEQGQVCATIQGFSSRVLPSAALAAPVAAPTEAAASATSPAATPVAAPAAASAVKEPEAVGELTLVPVWEVTEPEWITSWPQADQAVALIGGTSGQQQVLQARYPQMRILSIASGDSIETITATLQSGPPPTHLFWLLPAGEDDAGSESLIAAQHQGVLLGLRLVKALLALGVERQALGWTVITERAQAAGPAEAIAPAHASVHGFLGALAKEYPRWPMRLIDLDDGASLPLDALLRLPAHGQGNAWRYRLGQWQQQTLIQAQLESSGTPWRRNGIYVILGGAGGIGEVLSEHLIRHYQAHMIWIGRRPLDETIESKCQRLAAFGPQPHYLRADATDAVALQAALTEIQARHDHIDGLVNATIVLKDQPLARMDEADFAAALAAKVDVSVNVARVFREAVRDFVLVFSSLQSSVKAHGQSNYAAGCTFADAHAHALRSQWPCPVKVVNWGYWGSVGIVADEQTRQRMAKFGMESIEPPEAMQVLDKLLVSPVDQIAFVKTSKPEVALSLGLLPGQRITVTHPTQATTPPQPSTLPLPLDEQGRQQVQALEAQLAALLHARLHELGLCWEGKALDIAGWKQGIALPKLYERWLDQSLQMLVQYGHLKQEGQAFIGGPDPDSATLWQGWEQAKAESAGNPQQQAQLALLDAMLQALPAILRGQMPATQAMFPNASMALVENIYKNNRIADYFNAVLADSLIDHIEQRLAHDPQARLRLLEIGAGTGGTSAKLFERLAPYAERIEQYAYTDISKAFLLHAQKHYAHQAPYLHTQLFNVEAPLAGQDIEPGSYDIVIATNVLHATKDMRRTLRNTKALLKREGLLLVNEVATSSLFTHLTFGLLEGWWLYDDGALRIAGSPALAPATWQGLLQGEGFHRVTYPAEAAHALGQQVIAAVSNGVVRQAAESRAGQGSKATSSLPRVETGAASRGAASTLHEKTRAYLRTMVAQTLMMQEDEIDTSESLTKYGIDSILAVKITDTLGALFDGIDMTLLFQYQSVDALADYLVENQPDKLMKVLNIEQGTVDKVQAPGKEAVSASLRPVQKPARRFLQVPAQPAAQPAATQDIAIVGISGYYPSAANLQEYWSNFVQGVNCIGEIPASRWSLDDFYCSDIQQAIESGKSYCNLGGFLHDIHRFVEQAPGMPQQEAMMSGLKERLFLDVAGSALESAGYTRDRLRSLARSDVGVYVGALSDTQNYFGVDKSSGISFPHQPISQIAHRVSRHFDLAGPSIAVDTQSSSSMTAVHLACESLRRGESRMAIAGSVSLLYPELYVLFSRLQVVGSRADSRSFTDGDGLLLSEGAGAVVLKTVEQARADGDAILAVIKASGVNHAGGGGFGMAPNPNAQARLFADVLTKAGIDPRTISYVETAAYGSRLGDSIELAALTQAFRGFTADSGFCTVGSAKSHIGHAEAASGMSQLTKAVLQMQHRTLVPLLHKGPLNPSLRLEGSPFRLQFELEEWKRPVITIAGKECEVPLRAMVNSFGAGGAYGSLVLEEYRT